MEPRTAKRMVSLKIETTRNTTVWDPISTHLTASGEQKKRLGPCELSHARASVPRFQSNLPVNFYVLV